MLGEIAWLTRVLDDAITEEASGVSSIVVGSVTQVDVVTAKEIDILALYVSLRHICG